MNYMRIVMGGILGGIVFNLVSYAINVGILMGRYEILQRGGVLHTEPRLPFLPIHAVLLLLVSIGLVWMYAAARPRLGPGPKTALMVGGLIGLMVGLPANLVNFAWTYIGGFISMWWTIEMLAGCALATLAGAWIYRE